MSDNIVDAGENVDTKGGVEEMVEVNEEDGVGRNDHLEYF